MLRSVIFDMDGLMVDSEPVWASAWPPAFERYGLDVAPGLIEACVGGTRERISQLVAEEYDGNPDAQRALDDHYVIGARYFIESGAPKKPGLDELLDLLSRAGITCAVASSSERRVVEANLSHAGVSSFFDVVVTGDDGYPSKPAPDIFLAAAERLDADPRSTIVLEDSPAGIRAARAGGFVTIMVPDLIQPNAETRALCDHVCEDLFEVAELIAPEIVR